MTALAQLAARYFQKAPMRQKLLVVIVATTAAVLLLAGIGIVLMDSRLYRQGIERDLDALASIVGDNSTAALLFDDPHAAGQTLSALKARSHIVGACLYTRDGALFASYARPAAAFGCPPSASARRLQYTSQGLALYHPIILEGRRVGGLFLLYDLEEVAERIRLYSGVVLSIFLMSTALALLLSSGLRSLIAQPIARLAGAARSVSDSGDYSIRVAKESDDELGVLVDAFNQMLARVQERDEEVRSARHSLATTLASIGDAVVSTDAAGRIVFANPAAAALLRWPETALTGIPIDSVFRLVGEHTGNSVADPVRRALRDGAVRSSSDNVLLLARDGGRTPIDHSVAPIREGDEILGAVLVFRDTTARRRAQRDAAYLAAIVESTEDAVIGKSSEGVIQSWNAGAERVYGYTAAEAIGRRMLELIPVDRRHEESDILERMRSGEQIVHFETVRMRKDGRSIDVSLTISPIRDKSGQVFGVSHLARDITEQKRAAEQLRHTQKLESLGVLAGGIAHDFNNLLTGILGNASLALDDLAPSSPAHASIEAVIAASERAAQLAQQMLAYSGKGRFVLERIDVSDLVRGALKMIRAAIPASVELRPFLADGLPRIEADPSQMQQLVMNIIINAAEAIPPETRGFVTIVTRQEEIAPGHAELAPGPRIAFEVTDTGAGMDEETRSRIFDPFFTTKFTGRGLGLAAVQGIVRGHHGAIDVRTQVGEGTTFRILLPAAPSSSDAESTRRAAHTAAARDGGLILVVDDEQMVRTFAAKTLERYGYTVLLAENGERGLELFHRHAGSVRCVVLDLTMPVLSGEETLAHMKTERPEIPVILSSGFNEAQAVQRFEGKGLAGFLQKPYRADVLIAKVREILAVGAGTGPGVV